MNSLEAKQRISALEEELDSLESTVQVLRATVDWLENERVRERKDRGAEN